MRIIPIDYRAMINDYIIVTYYLILRYSKTKYLKGRDQENMFKSKTKIKNHEYVLHFFYFQK